MKILLHLRYFMVTDHIFKCEQKSAQKRQSGLDAVFSLLENVGNKLWACEATQTCTEPLVARRPPSRNVLSTKLEMHYRAVSGHRSLVNALVFILFSQ